MIERARQIAQYYLASQVNTAIAEFLAMAVLGTMVLTVFAKIIWL